MVHIVTVMHDRLKHLKQCSLRDKHTVLTGLPPDTQGAYIKSLCDSMGGPGVLRPNTRTQTILDIIGSFNHLYI